LNSRNKGKRGELELAAFLRDRGFEARRGQQHAGGVESPDVVTSLRDVHFEVKRVEAGNPYVWLEQAIRDAGYKTPVVAHRKSQQGWIAVMRLEDLLDLYRRLYPDAAVFLSA